MAKKIKEVATFSLTVPLPGIRKSVHDKTMLWIKENVKMELSKDQKKSEPNERTCMLFANYCHILDQVIRKNKEIPIDYDKVKSFAREYWDMIRRVVMKRFKYDQDMVEKMWLGFVHVSYASDGDGDNSFGNTVRVISGDFRDPATKNIFH